MYNKKLKKITSDKALIGIIGLGYVGLPLAYSFTNKDINVIGFDIDEKKISALRENRSYIQHIPNNVINEMNNSGFFDATCDFTKLSDVDVIIICVPTPLTKFREPDLTPVLETTKTILEFLKKGQLIILESSTYPGTTDEDLGNVLELSGLKKNQDFYLAYSPEREDPGNKDFSNSIIPKIVGADSDEALNLAVAVYSNVISSIIPVNGTRTAEAIKLTENIFRSVNIALVNELKVIYDAMGIDVWDVIDGASSKPFGYMPFYPGPGLGGHCIPVDPFYLTSKAREFGISTKFIELAGEINTGMPFYVVDKIAKALNDSLKKSVNNAKIMLIGISYKKDIDDTRETPSLVIMKELIKRGASVDFHDPFVNKIGIMKDHMEFKGKESVSLSEESIKSYDSVVICTDHSNLDYNLIAKHAKVIIDTRNSMLGFDVEGYLLKA